MDVFYYYTYGTAAWLGLQAAPLIVSPHMITPLLSPEMRQATGPYPSHPIIPCREAADTPKTPPSRLARY